MAHYILRRLILVIPVLVGVTIINFTLIKLFHLENESMKVRGRIFFSPIFTRAFMHLFTVRFISLLTDVVFFTE